MLYCIAQPTRKNPDALPRFEKLYGEKKKQAKREKTGDELADEFFGGMKGG